MVKWIYERWSPKWPDFTGGTAHSLGAKLQVTVLSYDGTLQDKKTYDSIARGGIFYMPGGDGYYPRGYYQKGSSSAYYISTVPPLAIKDTLIDTITAEEGTYPDDGVHSDQLYYVKIKKAFPTMRILRDGQWVEVETGYVLKDGVWKQIEEIYKLQDGQWVQA